jgi:hypothetical protein
MAYMNQDKKKIIKANLDKVLKPLGIKYSLSVQDNMSITCTVKEAPIDFIGNLKANTGDKFNLNTDDGYIQVNYFWYQDHFTGQAKDVIGQILDGLKSADYYDKSDSMVDYFDTAYYMHINIGRWDKPFILKGTK